MKTIPVFLYLLGICTAVVSFGQAGRSHLRGDGGPAAKAEICDPGAIAVVRNELFIAELCAPAIRRIDLASGIVTTLTKLPALTTITQMAVDRDGNLIAADMVHDRILRINSKKGAIEVIAGTGQFGDSGDGGPAIRAEFNQPYGVALDAAGNIYVADGYNKRIRRIDAQTLIISTVVGRGEGGIGGDGRAALEAGLDWPMSIAFDKAGNFYIAQDTNDATLTRIRKVESKTGLISTFVAAPNADFSIENSLDGSLYFADGHVIKKLDESTGSLQTIAGCPDCKAGFGREALKTRIEGTDDFTFDKLGNIYVSAFDLHRILRIRARDGVVEVFAGNGKPDHVHVLL